MTAVGVALAIGLLVYFGREIRIGIAEQIDARWPSPEIQTTTTQENYHG